MRSGAPGLRAGRGLKRNVTRNVPDDLERGAPGLRAGRGLKLRGPLQRSPLRLGSARPSGRARIETRGCGGWWRPGRVRSARPSGWARIETSSVTRNPRPNTCGAPGLRAGRGLKHQVAAVYRLHRCGAPGLRAGRGLKHVPRRIDAHGLLRGAPGLRAGRGLKRLYPVEPAPAPDRGSARPSGWARIETEPSRTPCACARSGAPSLRAGRGLKQPLLRVAKLAVATPRRDVVPAAALHYPDRVPHLRHGSGSSIREGAVGPGHAVSFARRPTAGPRSPAPAPAGPTRSHRAGEAARTRRSGG